MEACVARDVARHLLVRINRPNTVFMGLVRLRFMWDSSKAAGTQSFLMVGAGKSSSETRRQVG